ncbi:hypothetical protein NKH28_15835 [Mesorhizobium sp. M1227]|uniref:hypothetical protein n=1 Tax=Mesorhizobium sp. M1227 TaxID=2957071 RepID=UPI00333698E1
MSNPNPLEADLSSELAYAVERVYAAFASYPSPRHLHGSPYKDLESIFRGVSSGPLRELSGENLGAYAGSAIWTVGDVDDYRHFLPRVLELAIQGEPSMGFDANVIAAKLERTSWRDWPLEEQQAVEELFQAAWRKAMTMHPDEGNAVPWLEGIVLAGMDVAAALAAWHDSPYPEAMLHCADLITGNIKTLDKGHVIFSEQVTTWLLSDSLAWHLFTVAVEAPLRPDDREKLAWASETIEDNLNFPGN